MKKEPTYEFSNHRELYILVICKDMQKIDLNNYDVCIYTDGSKKEAITSS